MKTQIGHTNHHPEEHFQKTNLNSTLSGGIVWGMRLLCSQMTEEQYIWMIDVWVAAAAPRSGSSAEIVWRFASLVSDRVAGVWDRVILHLEHPEGCYDILDIMMVFVVHFGEQWCKTFSKCRTSIPRYIRDHSATWPFPSHPWIDIRDNTLFCTAMWNFTPGPEFSRAVAILVYTSPYRRFFRICNL